MGSVAILILAVCYSCILAVETSSEQAATNNFNCFDRGEVCPTDPPAEIPSSQTPCVGLDCPTHSRSSTESGGISTFYYIIGGAVGGVVILSVLVILTLLFLCFARLKRTLKNDSFEDNPTYESAGESWKSFLYIHTCIHTYNMHHACSI